MAYDYGLWQKRAKRYEITPIWAALATVILAPLGYWFNGDGIKGLKYTVIIFFAGYVTLGILTFVGAALLTYDVYNMALRHEKRFASEKASIDHSEYSWIFKGGMMGFLLAFFFLMFIMSQRIGILGA
jgi:hypothetical protein